MVKEEILNIISSQINQFEVEENHKNQMIDSIFVTILEEDNEEEIVWKAYFKLFYYFCGSELWKKT